MDSLDMLLGLDIEDEEKTRQMAEALRGRQRAADFFTGVQTPHVGGMAELEQAAIPREAQQIGGLRKALAERQHRKMLQDERISADVEAATLANRRQLARDEELNRMTLARDAEQQGYKSGQKAMEEGYEESEVWINPKTNKEFRARPMNGRMVIEGTEIPLPNGFVKKSDYDTAQRAKTSSTMDGVYGRRIVEDETGALHTVANTRDGRLVELTPEGPIPLTENAMEWEEPISQNQKAQQMLKLEQNMEPIQQITRAIDNIDDMLIPYARKGLKPEQIPGLGWLEKMPFVGAPLRGVQDLVSTGDTPLESAPQGTVNAAIKGLTSIIARNLAGLAQTKIELQKIEQQSGTDALTDPAVFAEFLDRIKSAVEQDLMRVRSTVHKSTYREFQENLAAGSEEFGEPLPNPFEHRFRRINWGQTGVASDGWGRAEQETP